jgi:nucleoside-diphosphate-sugar epimerase
MSGRASTFPAAPAAAPLALILGATGSAGRAAAGAFLARGWRVRAMHRKIDQPASGMEWVWGDAMDPDAVTRAAKGATVILHAVNPPGYRRWRQLAIPMLANSIAAAKASGARLIFPGNIYNYAPNAGLSVDERAPQLPVSRKGKVRVEMEHMLVQGARQGARSLVIRAGDFFGPGAATSWLHAAMLKPGKPPKSIAYPGVPSVGHLWAFLPDFAEAIVSLAAAERGLPAFDVFHFGGHWIDPGVEMAHEVARAVGHPELPIRPMPWTLLRLASPFSGFLRELLDVEYLWRVPIRLNNNKLNALIGPEPHTPLDEAVRRSLPQPTNTAVRS